MRGLLGTSLMNLTPVDFPMRVFQSLICSLFIMLLHLNNFSHMTKFLGGGGEGGVSFQLESAVPAMLNRE